MGIFEKLEFSPLALWVGESLWAYPFLLSLHAMGLAILVGVFVMLDLRLLGCFKSIRIESFLPVMKFAWVGFLINATSGGLLFTSQASTFVTSLPFLIKIGLIFVGAVLAAVIQGRLRAERDRAPGTELVGRRSKGIAVLSLLAWTGAMIAGRLIAYL